MKRKRYVLFLITILFLIVGVTTSCTRESTTGPRAWIDSPRGRASIPLGTPITIISHAYARDGLAEVVLYVNGNAYKRSAPAEAGADFSEFNQEWIPTEPGTYALQIRAFDLNGETSNPATISVVVAGDVIADKPVTPPTAIFTPVVPDTPTPTYTPVVSGTPTSTSTEPPWTSTPTLHPPTPTFTFTPTPTSTSTPTNTPTPLDTTPPPAPKPLVPADGMELSCRATQSLVWAPVDDPSGIEGYYVELEREVTSGKWQDVDAWGPISDKQIDVPVDCGIRYRWAVRARDGAGNFGDWSLIYYFAVNMD